MIFKGKWKKSEMWIPCDQILLLCDCSVCFAFGCAIHLFTMYLFIRSSAPNVFENESKSFSSPSGRHWNIWFEIKVFILFVYFKCIHLQRWWCLHWTKFHLVIINVVTTVWVKFHSHHNTNNTWIGCSDFPFIQMMKPFFNCKFTVSLNIWIVSLSLFIYWMAKIGANQFNSIPFNSIPFRLQPISAQVNGLHKSNNKLLVCQIAGNLPHKNGNKTTKTCKWEDNSSLCAFDSVFFSLHLQHAWRPTITKSTATIKMMEKATSIQSTFQIAKNIIIFTFKWKQSRQK